jgi:hypothetical protein
MFIAACVISLLCLGFVLTLMIFKGRACVFIYDRGRDHRDT